MPSTRCPACGAHPPEGARFCPNCGRPLGGGDATERKLATVLFADLAGSTELAASMDAETLRGLLAALYDQLSRAAEVYGGTVEKFIGDAVMAVFGVPLAHEDDPERAVRAALVMRSRLTMLGERSDIPMALRIGINTGPVVTGVTPGRDFLVTGEAVNLAARLQQAAEPGEILVGERTFRAVEPLARTVAPRSLRPRESSSTPRPRPRHPSIATAMRSPRSATTTSPHDSPVSSRARQRPRPTRARRLRRAGAGAPSARRGRRADATALRPRRASARPPPARALFR